MASSEELTLQEHREQEGKSPHGGFCRKEWRRQGNRGRTCQFGCPPWAPEDRASLVARSLA